MKHPRFPELVTMIFLLGSCGISGNAELTELDDEDWIKVCEDLVQVPDDTTFECDDGGSVTIAGRSVEECAEFGLESLGDCAITVDEFSDCYNALLTDPCGGWEELCEPLEAGCP